MLPAHLASLSQQLIECCAYANQTLPTQIASDGQSSLFGQDLALDERVEQGDCSERLQSSASGVYANEAVVRIDRELLAFRQRESRRPSQQRRIGFVVREK